jgi:diguanylate cyclase (GGDEF)-like protein
VISREEADRLRDQLLAVLSEDARNTQRLVARLDSITDESGIGAHAALLLILTHLPFEEQDARDHWQAILGHRQEMSCVLGRDAGLRVAVLDYFMNINRRLVQPTLMDLEMYETVQAEGSTDIRTGLATNRRFRATLQTEIRRARRYRQRASIVVVDLDEFAQVNERCGSLVGDRLLREVAILLNNNVRDIDVAARLGEDEIALLLPTTGRNEALLVAERFRREVEDFFARRESRGKPVELTVSAGVACYPDDASTPEALLERAAQALYRAKALGRNTVESYYPERRRYLRFDLDPDRFEIEVFGPADRGIAKLQNYSRSGVLFTCPERLEVGESIEIRLVGQISESRRSACLRGRVVRLEEMPPSRTVPAAGIEPDRYEVGVALDRESTTEGLLEFFEKAP